MHVCTLHALAVCSLSLFVVELDATIVTVALPAIGDGLHVGTPGQPQEFA
ncbi:hypothetical protein ACFQ9R_17295 [Nocardia sp. NPDC056541]